MDPVRRTTPKIDVARPNHEIPLGRKEYYVKGVNQYIILYIETISKRLLAVPFICNIPRDLNLGLSHKIHK